MSGEQIVAVSAGFLGLRWLWRSWLIGHHMRASERHAAKASNLAQRWW